MNHFYNVVGFMYSVILIDVVFKYGAFIKHNQSSKQKFTKFILKVSY